MHDFHPDHAAIVKAVTDALPTFKARNQGRLAGQILLSLVRVFPKDHAAAMRHIASLESTEVHHAPKAAHVPPVDATPKVTVPPRVGATSRPQPVPPAPDDDCDDCPPRGLPAGIGQKPGETYQPKPGKYDHLTTTEGVLEALQDNPDVLAMHAGQLGINTGGSRKPKTLAMKIAHHYRTLKEAGQ